LPITRRAPLTGETLFPTEDSANDSGPTLRQIFDASEIQPTPKPHWLEAACDRRSSSLVA